MTARPLVVPGGWRPFGNAGKVVTVDGVRIALFRVAGEILAVEDACVRCAASLAEGKVSDRGVTCPGCGWAYDLATGASRQVPAIKLHTLSVRDEPPHLTLEWPGPGD